MKIDYVTTEKITYNKTNINKARMRKSNTTWTKSYIEKLNVFASS